MKASGFDDVFVSIDSEGNALITGEFSVGIKEKDARRIFRQGISTRNMNDGLCPLIPGRKEFCLSVNADDLVGSIKLALSEKQVSEIKKVLSI